MANGYINFYKDNPTAGGTDGSQISLDGQGTAPLTFSLDASENESKTAPVALRCESGYQTSGLTTISFSGTTAGKWSACKTQGGTYTPSLVLTQVGATNVVFYVKAASASTEAPGNDTSVSMIAATTIIPSA